MELNYARRDANPRRLIGIGAVVVLHLFIGYALVSGLARSALQIVKKPLEAKIVQEILPPPPPPPPPPPKQIKQPDAPKVEAPPPPYVPPPEIAPPVDMTPAITATSNAPPVQDYKIEAPPPVTAPPAGPAKADIGVACPTQVKPEIPRKALQEGLSGIVRAEALVRDGAVREVTILSGPRVYHQAVRTAMLQYKCAASGEVRAMQEFDFKID